MTPILYSFRRCPYAMRARLALAVTQQPVELREILLREKAPEFLAASPSATVPCMVDQDKVIDESLDIMIWALNQRDPEAWLDMPEAGYDMIDQADGPFKDALDRTKYHTRYQSDPESERTKAHVFLCALDAQIAKTGWLFKATPSLADMAILPFIRQFAFIDKARFDAEPWPQLQQWLAAFLASEIFAGIMAKYPVWKSGDTPTIFPDPAG